MDIKTEMETARDKYGPFNSMHEFYGVLMEEVEEAWDEIKKKEGQRSKEKLIHELTQVAAVAQRAIQELEAGEIKFI